MCKRLVISRKHCLAVFTWSFSEEGGEFNYSMGSNESLGVRFNTMSIWQSNSTRLSPKAHDLSSHRFLDPITVPGLDYILWSGRKSESV